MTITTTTLCDDFRQAIEASGAIKGSSYILGHPTDIAPILVAEGFITAASLHEATGYPVVIAFYAANLTAVAQHVRHHYPTTTIVLCGDHDPHEDGTPNTGLHAVTHAATAIEGSIAMPDLEKKCDWNDVAREKGSEAVREAIEQALPHQRHVLDEVHQFLGRFICYPSPAAHIAHTLWIAHTHLMESWESTPRLAFLSPEPGSGKTRALEISETLVPRPVEAMNVTPAYLFRKVSDQDGLPTVLFDEIDTLFGPRAKEHEEVRGLLNAGHRRGASAGRCVVRGKVIETEELPAYCAVAIAGLGNLPDTILSRSVVIGMRRRASGETVEPYRRRLHAPQGYAIRDRLAVWATQVQPALNTYPVMPNGITDRNADIWESLLSIADAAGGSWPERARVSAVTLVTLAQGATPSLGIRLLADLKVAFGDTEAFSTVELLKAVISLEETPWGDLKGKPLSDRKLASFLRPYGISSKPIRLSTEVVKGYAKEDFYDAWARYLPSDSDAHNDVLVSTQLKVTRVTSATPHGEDGGEDCVGPPPQAEVTSVTPDTSNGELLFTEEGDDVNLDA
jgi:hypothetical protein